MSLLDLYANGKKVETKQGDKIFTFRIPLKGKVKLAATAGKHRDEINIRFVEKPNALYKLSKKIAGGGNWT